MTRRTWVIHSVAGLLVILAAALARNCPTLAPGMFNWAEPGNVAAAVVQGRGFSDPFGGGTGATAWVPPVPVAVDAAVFAVAGVTTHAAAAGLLVLSVIGLALAHALLLSALRREGAAFRVASSVVVLGFMVFWPAGVLEVQSEAWMDILLSTLLLWSVLEHRLDPGPRAAAGFAAAGLLGPVTHAGLTLATGVVIGVSILLDRRERRPLRTSCAPLFAAAAAALALGAWTVRNVEALGRPVPLKSNGWFELYLANVDSADGFPRTETIMRRMPFFSDAEFARYARLGELAYIDSFRQPALDAIRRAPGHFAANVGRRLWSAAVCCHFEGGAMDTHTTFDPSDRLRLMRAGLLLPMGGVSFALWTRIDEAPSRARAQLAGLGLRDFPGVWRDWAARRVAYDAENGLRSLVLGLLLSGLPTLALFGCLLARRGRPPAVVAWAVTILVFMVLPFVLVNHGGRHEIPLLALDAVIVGGCVQAWADRMGRGEAGRAT